MLTSSSKREIVDALSKTIFGEDSFEFRDIDDTTLLISFKLRGGFIYSISRATENDSMEVRFRVSYAPGLILIGEEPGFYGSLSAVIAGIPDWVERIADELTKSPKRLPDDIIEIQTLFIDGLSKVIGPEDRPFEKEELERLSKQLDQLKEQLASLLTRQSGTEEEVKALRSEVDSLKNTGGMPKVMWAKVAGSKLGRICVKFFASKVGQQLLADLTKRLLIGSGDGSTGPT